MKRWYCTLLLLLLVLPARVNGAALQPAPLTVTYIGATPLEQLAQGATGSGTLLYHRAGTAPEQALLVVRLSKPAGATTATADVYDVPSGLSFVPVSVRATDVTVPDLLQPAVRFQTNDGWWLRDGIPSYNLQIEIRGPIFATWGAENYVDQLHPGQQAVTITTRADASGMPVWDLRQVQPAFENMGVLRTSYAERKCSTPVSIERGPAPLWPYVAADGGFEQPIGTLAPPLVVDWATGKITFFSEIVPVRNQNCSYSLFSINQLAAGRANQADFETPFSFYDLSGQGRGLPNLIVRPEYYPARDRWSSGFDAVVQQGRTTPRDFETVRYSWRNAVGDGAWDYKIEVLGFQAYPSGTAIADGALTIDAPTYEALPGWVVERSWPIATFVATENETFRSSEGIYAWSPLEVGPEYVFGWSEQPRPQAFSTIEVGFRGEYRRQQDQPATLYFSPIDRKLHLRNAEAGVWRMTDQQELRSANLDGDAYLDQWRYTAIGTGTQAVTTTRELNVARDQLVYGDDTQVVLRAAAAQPSIFETLPPTNPTEWTAQQQQLAANKPDFAPTDFRAMMQQFAGPELVIEGGRLRDYRPVGKAGFRFVLTLAPNFQLRGSELVNLKDLAPGEYVVSYNGAFSVQPLTPPALSATLLPAALTQLASSAQPIEVRNTGLQDAAPATLELLAIPPQGVATVVATDTLTLAAQTTITPTLTWAPSAAGEWRITARLREKSGATIELASRSISVQPAPTVSSELLLTFSTTNIVQPFILLALFAFVGAAGAIMWRQWQVDGEPSA